MFDKKKSLSEAKTIDLEIYRELIFDTLDKLAIDRNKKIKALMSKNLGKVLDDDGEPYDKGDLEDFTNELFDEWEDSTAVILQV